MCPYAVGKCCPFRLVKSLGELRTRVSLEFAYNQPIKCLCFVKVERIRHYSNGLRNSWTLRMKITRHYRNDQIPASRLRRVRDYLNQQNSRSLGIAWAHKIYKYQLYYGLDDVAECIGIAEVESTVAKRGDTTKWSAYFQSTTGRLLKVDATDSVFISVEAANGDLTLPFIDRAAELLELTPRSKRVFVSHGRSKLWHEVARYIEKDSLLNLETVELAEQPNAGRSILEKLIENGDDCSYAVIVMTAEDMAGDDEMRVRENVMHEIGYFQARYGRDRVCLLHQNGANVPSNLSGLVYLAFDGENVKACFADLQKELRRAFPEAVR